MYRISAPAPAGPASKPSPASARFCRIWGSCPIC